VVEPRFRWAFAEVLTPSASALVVAGERGISARLAGLLASRGAVSGDDLVAWFAEPLDGLHDPARLPDAAVVMARLQVARDRGERVLVFGDFDADGLTGLAIMTLALRRPELLRALVVVDIAPVDYPPERPGSPFARYIAAVTEVLQGGMLAGGRRVAELEDRFAAHIGAKHAIAVSNGTTSSSPTITGSLLSCPRRSRSSIRTGRTRPTPTAGWRGAAWPSRSPSCCWPMNRGGSPSRSISPTLPRSGRSRMSPRWSARTGPSRDSASSGSGGHRGPGSPRCSRR